MFGRKQDAWEKLIAHARQLKTNGLHINDPARNSLFHASSSHITLNYQHQNITPDTLSMLFYLAHVCGSQDKIHALFNGDIVNLSENKPALHTALRAAGHHPIWVEQRNIMDDVLFERERLKALSNQIRSKQWLGFSGRAITDVVHIGIGGSDLGPRFCIEAFVEQITSDLNFHFISDADPHAFRTAVKNLQPDTTLFIVASKSFTTQETLFNARKAKAWIGDDPRRIAQHFIAVTANIQKAQQFGISTILSMWDWVGGRYSLCSSVNLITAIAIGFEGFNQLLAGARSMDEHFRYTDFSQNLPVLLGLLGVWNNNFLNIHQLLILTYSQLLKKFVPYVQQLDMESNGKSVDNQNCKVKVATGPIIWGGAGNQAQHSYYQLLCQGTHAVAADLITLNEFDGQMINEMSLDKLRVLSQGVHAVDELRDFISGGQSINHIQLADVSPFTTGALVALYEHKVFVQSVIWDINPFDQPGVECAKRGRRVELTMDTVAVD